MDISFLNIRILDIIDILLVTFLLYQIYKLLRGSLALNIFLGFVIFYLLTYLTDSLNMRLINTILSQFVNIGVLALLIVFQPEIRRFLLYLGRQEFFTDFSFKNIFSFAANKNEIANKTTKESIINVTNVLSESSTGALLVIADSQEKHFFDETGVSINSDISTKLLETIFDKSSALHDGAVILSENKIYRAGCILPVSENQDLPIQVGLRHRAAVGITEKVNVKVIVVSEETGKISYAKEGKLIYNLPKKSLSNILDVVLVSKEMSEQETTEED